MIRKSPDRSGVCAASQEGFQLLGFSLARFLVLPFSALGGTIREGCDSPEALATKINTGRTVSRVSRLTWLLEMPFIPIACTKSSTERVETPCT
jgi:hypothetical protein